MIEDDMDGWIDAINKRGMFARRTNADKPIVEVSTAQEWSKSVNAAFGMEVTGIMSVASDPPDCIGTYRGKPFSIELAELLKNEVRAMKARAGKSGEPIDLFTAGLWTADLLCRSINTRLDDKQDRYARSSVIVDALVIHSDEDWLQASDVKLWLGEGMAFEPRPNIRSAYLLLTYQPQFAPHWPVFRLYG